MPPRLRGRHSLGGAGAREQNQAQHARRAVVVSARASRGRTFRCADPSRAIELGAGTITSWLPFTNCCCPKRHGQRSVAGCHWCGLHRRAARQRNVEPIDPKVSPIPSSNGSIPRASHISINSSRNTRRAERDQIMIQIERVLHISSTATSRTRQPGKVARVIKQAANALTKTPTRSTNQSTSARADAATK